MFNFSKLGKLLVNKNISQVKLAEITGLTPTAINGMVKGRYKSIDSGNLEKIAKALDVPIGYFFDETEISTNQSTINFKTNEPMTISPESIENLIRQNGELVNQVSAFVSMQQDLISMQKLNAETINNFSANENIKKKAS